MDNKRFTLYNDDCLNALKAMEDNSIDSCVTDPPYGLSFMGNSWDYDVPQKEIWEEVFRVLKPGGHLLAFFGSRTYHRGAVQIEDAGFEVRDQIMWLYGSGFPKSHNIGNGWGTALKPAHEPIVVARKPISQTIAKNVLEYGTGALNIDGCRVSVDPQADASQLRTMQRGKRENDTSGQKWGMSKSKGDVPQVLRPEGRWPANVIHDGSDEVVSGFPDANVATSNSKKKGNGYGSGYGEMHKEPGYNDSGSAARFFYCAKASKSDRDEGLEELLPKKIKTFQMRNGASGNTSSISAGRNTEYRNTHPTVKPTELMKYLVRLVTPPNGTVLDPFMGSGTTGKAAMIEGFNFIGIEREKEYFEIAEKRIEAALNNTTPNLESFFT